MARHLNIVCVSGTLEKLQMAAMFASVAAACGDKVTVFFSMNAMNYFIKGRTDVPPVEGSFGPLLMQDGIPPFKQLFEQAAELGDAVLLPCSMAVDLLKASPDDFDIEFGPPTGLTRFLSDSEDGELLTF